MRLSTTLLEQIREAEQQAEQIRSAAGKEAREIIKSVEEAVVQESRQGLKDIHEGAQRLVEETRISTGDEIKTLELRRSAEREAMKALAQSRIENAGRTIFERVVANGHR